MAVTANDDKGAGATIFEVAEAAGVSITTVSHVFSGKRQVNERTRTRVLEAASRLAYKPRSTARALATGRTMTLAVQFPHMGPELVVNPFFTALLPGLSAAAVARGYAFAVVPPDPSPEAFIEPLVSKRGVDAAILIDPQGGDSFPVALADAGVPYVSLGRVPGLPDNPRVDQDFDAAIAEILAHLRGQGYGRPALLTTPLDTSSDTDIRAFFDERTQGGQVEVAADLSDAAAIAAAERLLRRSAPPDAIICAQERQAVGTYRAAAALGVAVPGDLGVVSIGDSSVARELRPPATALDIFPEQMGEALLLLVHEILNTGRAADPVKLVPTRLLPRESTLRRG